MKNTVSPLKTKIYAKMLLNSKGEKTYETFNEYDKNILQEVSAKFIMIKDFFPFVKIQSGYNTNQILNHNYSNWTELFSERQLFSIWCFMSAIREIDNIKLRRLFAAFSGVLEFNNLFCSFKGEGTGAVRHMFSHHILKPELMPIEANIWGTEKSSGSFSTLYRYQILNAINYKNSPSEIKIFNGKSYRSNSINNPIHAEIAETFKEFSTQKKSVYLSQGDSKLFDIPNKSIDIVITDPPFFDNVHYSELADFFYYWLNQMLNISAKTTTRNAAEVQDTDVVLFSKKLTDVFTECNRILRDGGLFIFTYHHSRYEGWMAVHKAVRLAGFHCRQTFPIKAEMSVAMPLQQAKIPIHVDLIVVCSKQKTVKSDLNEQIIIENAIAAASNQINELSENINISLGDAKVALMGRFLCELSRVNDLERELNFLTRSESRIDELLERTVTENRNKNYNADKQILQLNLFGKTGEYLVNRMLPSGTTLINSY
ncbi:MAG: hypothetical protein R2941_20045 [Desulfobacterales bacterium]